MIDNEEEARRQVVALCQMANWIHDDSGHQREDKHFNIRIATKASHRITDDWVPDPTAISGTGYTSFYYHTWRSALDHISRYDSITDNPANTDAAAVH